MIRVNPHQWMFGALALTALLFAACGDDAEQTDTDTDNGVETTLSDPATDLVDVAAVAIDSVRVIGDDTLELTVTGGAEPCFIIERVDKEETSDEVILTVHAGSEPDAICIEILEEHTTLVDLQSPLGNRTIIDQTTGLPALLQGAADAPEDTSTSTTSGTTTTTTAETTTTTAETTSTTAETTTSSTEVEITTGEVKLVDVEAVAIDSVRVIGDDTLELTVTGGVEPCFIIDWVDKEETSDEVILTVYAGSEPDAICIEILEEHTTLVDLQSPLGNRTIIDQTTGLPALVIGP